MKKDGASPSAPSDQEQQQPAPKVPWLPERLTEAEIEALRQDQNEALESLQKAYPSLKVHRAGEIEPDVLR